jgi:hypothetical protein
MLKEYFMCGLVFLSLVVQAQKTETLKPSTISKLIPSKVKGFSVKGDSKSSVLTIGSLRYSLSEKVFSSRDQSIKILLFDYVEAPIMFDQSLKKWEEMPEVQTDSVVFSKSLGSYGHVWESSHPHSKRSKLQLSINKRFFLTLEAENMSLEELKEFFKSFDLEKFPK